MVRADWAGQMRVELNHFTAPRAHEQRCRLRVALQIVFIRGVDYLVIAPSHALVMNVELERHRNTSSSTDRFGHTELTQAIIPN